MNNSYAQVKYNKEVYEELNKFLVGFVDWVESVDRPLYTVCKPKLWQILDLPSAVMDKESIPSKYQGLLEVFYHHNLEEFKVVNTPKTNNLLTILGLLEGGHDVLLTEDLKDAYNWFMQTQL